MSTAFIACEYNPFHNGHKYHIDSIKAAGFDNVVCIMSGNFVQRGDIALFEKHRRAEIALMNGADLVLELPLKYAVSTASLFAEGFIKTAAATGLKGSVSFGAKNNIDELLTLEKHLFSEDAEIYCIKKLREGINYPNAKQAYISEKLSDKYAEILSDGNNTLALEYIRAGNKYFPDVDFYAVKRDYAAHDSGETYGSFSSARNIRNIVYDNTNNDNNGIESILSFIPDNSHCNIKKYFENGQFPRDLSKYEMLIISRLIMLDSEDFQKVNNVTEGIENKLICAIKENTSINDILDSVKSKRFTYSRLRQILLNAALGISKDDINSGISYIRVLGFNEKGRELLHVMKSSSALQVISNLSEVDKKNTAAIRDAYLDYQAGKLFALCDPILEVGNPEYEIPPIYIKKQ